MDYILTQTNQLIGFYEYNQKLNTLYLSDGFKENIFFKFTTMHTI